MHVSGWNPPRALPEEGRGKGDCPTSPQTCMSLSKVAGFNRLMIHSGIQYGHVELLLQQDASFILWSGQTRPCRASRYCGRIMIKIVEKTLLCCQPGFLPFRSSFLHINATSDDTWVSIVV
ncbi:hypothetical protein TcCL_ESM10925 [Trypanosoma cruzi]|nr:hypothetical protein TcCL_ESM10925 [Trypanosoma cruzi]